MKRFFLCLAASLLALGHTSAPAQSPAPSPAAGPVRKLVVLGNSITKHGPNEKIGWSGNWGMAASAEEKDFSHLLARGIGARSGTAPELLVRNIAAFEREFTKFNAAQELAEVTAFKADLIVLAIGENVPKLATEELKTQFQASLAKLFTVLKSGHNPTIIVRSSFWADPVKDQILKSTAEKAGAIFVDISTLGKDEANYARSERDFKHEGVARHPGDKGMAAIADAILAKVPR